MVHQLHIRVTEGFRKCLIEERKNASNSALSNIATVTTVTGVPLLPRISLQLILKIILVGLGIIAKAFFVYVPCLKIAKSPVVVSVYTESDGSLSGIKKFQHICMQRNLGQKRSSSGCGLVESFQQQAGHGTSHERSVIESTQKCDKLK